MKKQIKPILIVVFIAISSVFLLLSICKKSPRNISDSGPLANNPKANVGSAILEGTGALEHDNLSRNTDAKKPKVSDQTLIKISNQSDLNSFLSVNNLNESDIRKSDSLPNTYIVNKPKTGLSSDSVSLYER